jgi:hypothetical protein
VPLVTWRRHHAASAAGRQCWNQTRSGGSPPAGCADADCCRKRRRNAHGIAEREVLYEWHPWFGRVVRIHEVIEKTGGDIFRCSCNDEPVDRGLELPGWMFDRAACTPMQISSAPLVTASALRALRLLLAAAVPRRVDLDGPSTTLAPDAALSSHDQTRGESHATAARASTFTSEQAVRPVHRTRRRQPAARAGLGITSAADPCGADRPHDALDPRSRPEPSPSRAGGGAR